MKEYNIPEIDLVIVDLYPFEETLRSTKEEKLIIEKIDIGGPSMIRAAAKNFSDLVVIAAKDDYASLVELLQTQDGETDLEQLAKIFNILGTPTVENWPNVQLLPNYVEFEPRSPMDLIPLFDNNWKNDKQRNGNGQLQYPPALDLMLKMLTLNPLGRITAKEVR